MTWVRRLLFLAAALALALPAAPEARRAARSDAAARLGTVSRADLPPAARETLALIDRGGPFPYRRDGVVFANRERLLPPRPRGYYHEYTVPTPGASDRGARRIVAGSPGERYYSDDHYRSFRRIED